MKRGILGLAIVALFCTSTTWGRQPAAYYTARRAQPSAHQQFGVQFDGMPDDMSDDFGDEDYDMPAEAAAPPRSNGSAPREAVPAPPPFEHAGHDGYHHHGHHDDGLLWPEYYGPPYGGLGYDPHAPHGLQCSPCGGCLPIWVQFDYLMWWGKGGHVPGLVTTSPVGTDPGDAGVLSYPETSVLFGYERLDSRMRSGGRTNFGLWLDGCQQFGVGGSFFAVGKIGTNYDPTSDGSYILARPFYNVETDRGDAELVGYPGFVAGDIAVRSSNYVMGAEAYFRESLKQECDRRLDAIYGYRFMRLDESLHINDTTISIEQPSIIPLGTTVAGSEYFLTRNQFHGAEFGLWYQSTAGRWGWDVLAKIALGTLRQNVDINGQTIVTVPGVGTDVQPGSLYALPTNMGSYKRNQFSAIPEVQINVTRCITDKLKARFGYTFMLMTSVVQAGRQIDPVINPTQIGGDPLVGPALPDFEFQNTHYWLQGINFGLEYSY